MKLRIRCDLANGSEGFFIRSRDKQVRAVGEYPLGNLRDLFSGFALSENDFREPEPEVAMMVDSREGDVFVRQACHLVGGLIDVHPTGSHLLQQLLDSLSVHQADCNISATSSSLIAL